MLNIANGFQVKIYKEELAKNNTRKFSIMIKSNINGFNNHTALLTKQELAEVAKTIINFLSEE